MKIILLALCAFILTVQVYGDDDSSSMKSFQECLAENDINEDDLEELEKKDDPKLRCIMACVLEKEGILKNGDIDKTILIRESLNGADKLGEIKVTEIVNNCISLAKDLTDICDKSNVVGMCMKDELEKLDVQFH